ncbi:hypothetical protein V8E54_012914 [Elaphomyces granulatus]
MLQDLGPQPGATAQRRRHDGQHSQYTDAIWSQHRPKIKGLYMDQNLTLKQTMGKMKEHGFCPSEKMYKEKFQEWNFVKNLSKTATIRMLRKQQKRQAEDPTKDTIFMYRGQEWTLGRVLTSAKKGKISEEEVRDTPTPGDIVAVTPQKVSSSPQASSASPSNRPGIPIEKWTPMPSSSRTRLGFLDVTWNGQSLAVVGDKIQEAQSHEQNGELEDAERRYREALAALENLLSPTHDDTNIVGYHLASFYAIHDRMDEADSVLNWMTKKHVQRWGFLHSKTQSHFLRILDMLKDWSRGDTAMAFAYRVLDRWDQNIDDLPRVSGNRKDPTVAIDLTSDDKDLDDALAEIDDPARADYQVEIANTRAERNGGSAEGLFLRLAEQCQKYPTKLEMHTLKIKASLVRLYQQREDGSQIGVALGEVRDAIHAILASSSEKTEDMMEVCIDVIALCFKDEDQQNAKDLYQNVADKAEDLFGSDDDVTIGLLIRIGNIYQNENQWSNAQPWFEKALSASMSAGLHSTMTERLEKALENKRYSVETLTYRDIESCVRLRGLRSYLGN